MRKRRVRSPTTRLNRSGRDEINQSRQINYINRQNRLIYMVNSLNFVDFYFETLKYLSRQFGPMGVFEMRVFTVTCDGRPAAVVRASCKTDAIALALDLAEQRNLLGLVAGPRRFDAREPSEAEMVEWLLHHADHIILGHPLAA